MKNKQLVKDCVIGLNENQFPVRLSQVILPLDLEVEMNQ